MMNPNTPDSIALLRVHLQDKSTDELISLLLDLIQQVDEPTRQQFWKRLAPPGLATADLRYPLSRYWQLGQSVSKKVKNSTVQVLTDGTKKEKIYAR